jgi:hypothetical protein
MFGRSSCRLIGSINDMVVASVRVLYAAECVTWAYVVSDHARSIQRGAAPAAEKRAIIRQLKQMSAEAVLLVEDETILRLFPILRRAWSMLGEQARVYITGRNAKRVLLAAINVRTGHRVVMRRRRMRQEDFQDFLHLMGRR